MKETSRILPTFTTKASPALFHETTWAKLLSSSILQRNDTLAHFVLRTAKRRKHLLVELLDKVTRRAHPVVGIFRRVGRLDVPRTRPLGRVVMAFDIGAPAVHELALALSSPHTRVYLVPRAAGAMCGPGGMGVGCATGACEGPVRARGRRERGVIGRRTLTPWLDSMLSRRIKMKALTKTEPSDLLFTIAVEIGLGRQHSLEREMGRMGLVEAH